MKSARDGIRLHKALNHSILTLRKDSSVSRTENSYSFLLTVEYLTKLFQKFRRNHNIRISKKVYNNGFHKTNHKMNDLSNIVAMVLMQVCKMMESS